MPDDENRPTPPPRQPVVYIIGPEEELNKIPDRPGLVKECEQVHLRPSAHTRSIIELIQSVLAPFLKGGRPSSRNLIRTEAQQQLASGTAPLTLQAFGYDLSAWLQENHPNAPPMAPSTVEDNIRDLWTAAGR